MPTIYKYTSLQGVPGMQHLVIRTTASEVPQGTPTEQHLWLPDAAAADLVQSMQRPIIQFMVGDQVTYRANPEVYTVIACSIDKRGVICCTTRSDLTWVPSIELHLVQRATEQTIALAWAHVEYENANALASML